MAPTVPTGEPATAVAGDTWLWQTSFQDYPSSEGWSLSYAFRGPGLLDTEAAEVVQDGTSVTVTIPASKTADLSPGTYYWTATATGSGSYAGRVHVAGSGRLEVSRNLRLTAEGDALTWEERTLPVLEAAIAGKLTDDMASYMIGGRQVVTIPLREQLALRDKMRREIARQRGRSWQTHSVVFP